MIPSTTNIDAIWAVLVKECAAPDHLRDDFMYRMKQAAGLTSLTSFEFRFCGSLGFGGKLYARGGKFYVSTYPEELNPERSAAIKKANTALAALAEKP